MMVFIRKTLGFLLFNHYLYPGDKESTPHEMGQRNETTVMRQDFKVIRKKQKNKKDKKNSQAGN